MLGFGGAPMPCSPALQTGNKIVIKIAHMQISSHLSSMSSLISMISWMSMLDRWLLGLTIQCHPVTDRAI